MIKIDSNRILPFSFSLSFKIHAKKVSIQGIFFSSKDAGN